VAPASRVRSRALLVAPLARADDGLTVAGCPCVRRRLNRARLESQTRETNPGPWCDWTMVTTLRKVPCWLTRSRTHECLSRRDSHRRNSPPCSSAAPHSASASAACRRGTRDAPPFRPRHPPREYSKYATGIRRDSTPDTTRPLCAAMYSERPQRSTCRAMSYQAHFIIKIGLSFQKRTTADGRAVPARRIQHRQPSRFREKEQSSAPWLHLPEVTPRHTWKCAERRRRA
jgi:hypothetical protein